MPVTTKDLKSMAEILLGLKKNKVLNISLNTGASLLQTMAIKVSLLLLIGLHQCQ